MLAMTMLFTLVLTGCHYGYIGPGGKLDSSETAGTGGNHGSQTQPAPQSGQLTAAAWSDLDQYDLWLSLFTGDQENATGVFESFLDTLDLGALNRVPVRVTVRDQAASGVVVRLLDGDTVLSSAVSDASGMANLFPLSALEGQALTIMASGSDAEASREFQFSASISPISIDLAAAALKLDRVQIMFVVDTTGSMSDELEYLKSELQDVISQTRLHNPGTDIAVALMFYRDSGDEYITRYFDFTENLDVQCANIAAQSAAGGGDFPEAVHTALSEAVGKQWSSGPVTRLLIHVADAPPHTDDPAVMASYGDRIASAAAKGIRIIPVASSGIDSITEYLFRTEAIISGGSYVFLTDESGIGEEHLEPTIGDYVVEYLNALLVRLIGQYHTGQLTAPVPYSGQ
jgi:hypothetical protein